MSIPRKIRCTVESITDHGGRVYTVDLLPDSPVPVFRPGQFLHLAVDEYDPSSFWPESRVFSIASSPRERDRIRICYSVKGTFTTRMEEILRAGSTVWIKLPYGDFVIDKAADAVLVAGGTGISAFTAFIEALDPQHARTICLIYGVRSCELFLFSDLIRAQRARVPNFRAIHFVEDLTARLTDPVLFPGRIALEVLWKEVPAPTEQVWYLSGPPPMLSTLGSGLRARGVAAENVRTDAWE